MKLSYSEFARLQAALAISTAGATEKTKILEMAVASTVAKRVPIPTTEVGNSSVHFNTVVLPSLTEFISALNEGLVFDCKAVIEYTRILWTSRYEAAHNTFLLPSATGTFLEIFNGMGALMPPELAAFANANTGSIIEMARFIKELGERFDAQA